jgi:hypothetical protein
MRRLFRRWVAGGVMLLAAWPATAQDAWCGITLCLAMQPGFAEVMLTNAPPVVTLPALGGSVSGDYATGRAGWLPLPFVDTESEIKGDARNDLFDTNAAQTYLHYQAMVVSKVPFTGTLLVPVTVQGDYVLGAAATPGTGRGSASVLLKADVSDAPSFFDSVDTNDCALDGPLRACNRVGSFSLAGQVRVGTAFSLDLFAFASSNSFRRLGLAQGRAFLDPLVSIDPTFASADSLFVMVSVGAGNTAPVPEPNSLLMWLAGATALAAACRRARPAGQSARPVA